MSFNERIVESEFHIAHDDFDEAYRYITEADLDGDLGADLVEALNRLNFEVVLDDAGIVDISCEMKCGRDADAALAALAPVVAAGSFVVWEGEGFLDFYRYDFDGKAMSKSIGYLAWRPVDE